MLDLLLNLANRFHFQEGEGKGSSGMRKIFFVLRIIQLICASKSLLACTTNHNESPTDLPSLQKVTVIALMGYYVQNFALIISATSKGRTQVFYTISINAIFVGVDALACVLIFYSGVYTFWILEMLHVPVLFFVAWYLLWDYISTMPCGTNIWDWSEVAEQDMCGHWKAAMAFSFIEAFIWMVGGVLVGFRFG